MDLHSMRQEYSRERLHESNASADAMMQFKAWFDDHLSTNPVEPNVMSLATVDAEQQPWQRIVLLKELTPQGFVFFTNYQSFKGQQLAHNPKASAHFFWPHLERQVQVHGTVKKLEQAQSQAYFSSRPRQSQLGAWASQQSRVLDGREHLDAAFNEAEQRFDGQDIPMPDYWGGYCLEPQRLEFWQGGERRLHDRLHYVRSADRWLRERLSP